jgi:hypothetical protein
MPRRVLDRIPQKDERSRRFGVDRAVPAVPTKGRAWTPGRQLDQLSTGHCGGFSVAAEAAASPFRVRGVTDAYAHAAYYMAKDHKLDPWGREEGTSTLAMMKVGVLLGLWRGYAWAFSVDDVKRQLELGPVLLGIPWWTGMFRPNADNVIEPTGTVEGGHLVIVRRWTPTYTMNGKRYGEAFGIRNSWGGEVNSFLTRSGLHEVLVNGQGESGVPMERRLPDAA